MSNTRFPFVTGITLCPDDTTDYVITGATTFSDDPNVATGYVDGVVYHTFVRYPDNITSKHEELWGAYNASTNTIARTRIGKSSAGYGVPVDWNDGGAPKHIAAVVSGAELGNMASVFIDLEPWEDGLIGFTGQSNGTSELAYYTGSGPADTTRVLDWSRIAANTGSPAWRLVVKADQYTYTATNPHLGIGRSRLDGTWKKTGSIILALADRLAIFTGRKMRTVSVTRGATGFVDPVYGWIYNPSVSTMVSSLYKASVDDAIAQMHIDDPRQSSTTKLHLNVLAHGESDAAGGEAGSPYYTSISSKYGDELADFLRALEDPNRWDICDENTIHLLYDIPCKMRELRIYQANGVNEFDGHAQAAVIFGPRAIVVSPGVVAMRPDGIHATGEGADATGEAGADVIASNTHMNANNGGAVRLVKNYTYPDPQYIRDSDSDASAPSATIRWRFNVAHTVLKVHKTSNIGDMEVYGLGNFQIGDVLRFEENGVPADYIDVTIASLATDNTTWFAYNCTEVSVGTVAAGVTFIIKPQNCAFHDGKSYTAAIPHNIASTKQNLVNKDTGYSLGAPATIGAEPWRNHHMLIDNEQGRQYRSRQLAPRYGALRTTGATLTELCRSYHFEDGRVERIKATVCYKVPANGNAGEFVLRGTIRRTGSGAGATVLDGEATLTVELDEEALATVPALTAVTFFGTAEGWVVKVTGKAATNIDWVVEVETIEIPTSP